MLDKYHHGLTGSAHKDLDSIGHDAAGLGTGGERFPPADRGIWRNWRTAAAGKLTIRGVATDARADAWKYPPTSLPAPPVIESGSCNAVQDVPIHFHLGASEMRSCSAVGACKAIANHGNRAPQALHLPDWRGNPYQSLLADGITSNGWTVEFSDFPGSLLPLQSAIARNPNARVLHLHWADPYIKPIAWASSRFRFQVKAAMLAADIRLARARGRRVVWTVHNEISHESPNVAREREVNRILARSVDHLIFHSESARQKFCEVTGSTLAKRSSVIPHGHYIGCYPDSDETRQRLRRKFGIGPEHTVLLIFGAIRRYKGIPAVLAGFSRCGRQDLRIIVAGNPFETDLEDEIRRHAERDPRILLHLGHIEDAEVGPLSSLADAMIFGFERTLTSGSVILAMSKGLAVILPERARALDVVTERGALFFDGEADLTRLLETLDPGALREMGPHNLDCARGYDWTDIGHAVVDVYNRGARAKSPTDQGSSVAHN